MKLFLASVKTILQYDANICDNKDIYILESFYYIDKFVESKIPKFKDFLLDSGAFTLFNAKKQHNIDWNEYIERYANFIKRNNIEHFFELDIDSIIGYENVLKLRKKIEKLTGKPVIPVFHKSRGLQEWDKMLEEYNYVAIGTIGEYNKRPDILYYLLKKALKKNVKVHGLGYTSLKNLKKMPFYSVDSTSWTTGNRFGYIYKFDGKTIIKFDKKDNERVKTVKTAINNFNEWVKFQKYMDKF